MFLSSLFYACSSKKPSTPTSFEINQVQPSSVYALKNLKAYTLFPMYFSSSQEKSNKILLEIFKTLEEKGTLKRIPSGELVKDISLISCDANIIFEISPINNSKLYKASLRIETGTTIKQNGEFLNSIIWHDQLFGKEKLSESTIISAFQYLFNRFMTDYQKVNKEAPSFFALDI